MRYFMFHILIFLLTAQAIRAQKVGLVLSGGGAKGAVHIGVIKALEENNVPVDYITGTSIGAIVGSLYAMGYSPDEMLQLMLSDEFGNWQSGTVESNYINTFKRPDATPEIARFSVAISDSLHIKPHLFPQSLINPIQMNQAFLGLYAQASARAFWNFDNLFVPFRCVASNVYSKKPVVFRNGDLGDAVRASMSFPFVFKPIWKDSVPLFDGGIYDNFPVSPMMEAFHPGFIIGSAVAGMRDVPSDNIYEQLKAMIMQKTEYDIPEEDGVMLKFNLPDVTLLDFQRAKELMEEGYRRTVQLIDSIKQRAPREVSREEVAARREAYKKSLPPLVFRNITVNGMNEAQKAYIEAQLHRDINGVFTMEDFKYAYFKMLANSKIKEIIPHAIYNWRTETFDLFLDVEMSDDISVSFGGNVSSYQANQLFLGVGYQHISTFATDLDANFQVGNSFDGANLNSRFYLQTIIPSYINIQGIFSNKKYTESQSLFYEDVVPAFIKQKELFMSLKFGFPFLRRAKAEVGAAYGRLDDYYFQTLGASLEHSRYNVLNNSFRVEYNTLDYKQYPISGRKLQLTAQYAIGTENFMPAPNSPFPSVRNRQHNWIQLKGYWNHYHIVNPSFNLGFLGEFVVSNKELHTNYTASILQAPAFTPTPHSIIRFNEAFRANQYVAAGISPILKTGGMTHLRADLFCFAPLRKITKAAKQSGTEPYTGAASYGKWFGSYEYMGEVSFVIQFPFASISLYANGYSYPANNFNFGINIGYLIFNPKLILQ